MFKSLLLVAIIAASYTFASEVVVLGDATLDSTINSNKPSHINRLQNPDAPWCGHCKALEPEYKKAAEQLSSYEPKVVIAKVDATEEKKSAADYGIEGFPTLKWFVNGKVLEYSGGRTADTIVSWIKKKTGPATKTITSASEFNTFKDSAKVVVVGAFANENEMKAFEEAASTDEEASYGSVIAPSKDILSAMGVSSTPAIVLFKKFDEGRVDYKGEQSTDAIVKFVSGNALPLIVPFSQETAQKIFGGLVKQHVLLFLDSSKTEESNNIKQQLKEVAEANRGKYLFVTVDKTDSRVIEFFGVTAADMPTARVVELTQDGMKKFKLVGNPKGITVDAIKSTLLQHGQGELAADLKSEDVPASNEGAVKVLVGKNFDDIVDEPGKDVFVEFYAPWCGHCKKLAPIWEQLGERYKSNPNMVIAKMDATANEVDRVQVSGFPSLKLFPADSKEIVDYDGARELDAMIAFLEKNAKSCAA